jgi:hypothetical protein
MVRVLIMALHMVLAQAQATDRLADILGLVLKPNQLNTSIPEQLKAIHSPQEQILSVQVRPTSFQQVTFRTTTKNLTIHMKPVTIGMFGRLTTVTVPPMKTIRTYQLPLLKDSFHMSQNSQQSVALLTLITKLISKKISMVTILEGQIFRQSLKLNLVSPGKIKSTKSTK